jgi:NADH dehydrogenase [ubiquinone] 1 alpha subcomplex assembly factor 7
METPLLRILIQRVRALGPLTVAEYMHTCLLHPQFGYYQRATEKIGRGGDFITAPEVSPVFGELVSLWFLVQWRDWLQSPDQVQLIELGPGRGTLMATILATAKQFPEFYQALQVQLLEASRPFRAQQQHLLQPFVEDHKVTWLDSLDDVELAYSSPGKIHRIPVLFLAHEFFDALPVHHLIRSHHAKTGDSEWLERLIDVDDRSTDGTCPRLRFVKSRSTTPAAALWPSHPLIKSILNGEPPESMEVPTHALAVIERLARVIEQRQGVALVVDYAKPSTPPLACTLRGVRNHRFEDPLIAPGEADLTTDVDFALLAKAVEYTSPGLQVMSLSQSDFLRRMGIETRMRMLMQKHRDKAATLEAACQRLVSPDAMGHIYRVMNIASPAENTTARDCVFPFGQVATPPL